MKLCVTASAAANTVLPAWLAVSEHVPTLTATTYPPETVHTPGVFETTVTASPELAETLSEIFVPNGQLNNVPNVIVWLIGFTANVCVIGVAGA